MFCILTSCPYNYYYSNCALETISSETQVEAKNGGLVVMVSAAMMVMLEVVVVGGMEGSWLNSGLWNRIALNLNPTSRLYLKSWSDQLTSLIPRFLIFKMMIIISTILKVQHNTWPIVNIVYNKCQLLNTPEVALFLFQFCKQHYEGGFSMQEQKYI